ncbi:NADPH oxidase organizer 1 [Rhinophrynus dorsalis]
MPQRNMMGTARHPLEATAIGVLQHGKFKHNMFSILWSDNNEILIYRTFEDFKKLSRQLRKKYPLESGLFKKSENLMPKLKDVPIFRRNRATNRFIERLRLLEKYSQELLRVDGKISQSDLVIKFYTAGNQDLNPTFPENSLVIMPSEVKEQKRKNPKEPPKPPSTHHIVSQQYMCMEDYETKDTKNRPFKVKRHELVGVLIKESSGWWLVENEEKRVAWFPAPYLKDLESSEETDSGMDSDDEGVLYYASKAYEAMSSDEISVTIGVLVEAIEKSNNGWWLIRYNGRTGYVPSMYLKPYRSYQQLQIMINQGKFTSTPNLFKASSTLTLNKQSESGRPQEEPDISSTGDQDLRKLDRRKSRSLYGLSSVIQAEAHAPAGNLVTAYGVGSAENLSREWKSKPKQRIGNLYKAPSSESGNLTTAYGGGSTENLRKKGKPKPKTRMENLHKASSFDSEVLGVQGGKEEASPLPRLITAKVQNVAPVRVAELPLTQCAPKTPAVPQRPKPHEILHRCTTLTKQALQRPGTTAELPAPTTNVR